MNSKKLLGLLVLIVSLLAVPLVSSAHFFQVPIDPGSSGSEVTALQQALQAKGFYSYPSITGYYGSVTLKAVEAFQKANGILTSGTPDTNGFGRVGPRTLTLLNSSSSLTVSVSTQTTSTITARVISLGSKGSDVLLLQKFLNTHGFQVAPSGPGSSGNETTLFGQATLAALIKFQKSQGITQSIGTVDATTLARINALSQTTVIAGPQQTQMLPPGAIYTGSSGGMTALILPPVVTTPSAPSDSTPPVRSAGSPSGTFGSFVATTTISLATDEAATCKYSASPGTAYASMTAFGTTGSTTHSTVVSGLSSGTSYTYYVKCSDTAGNIDATDYAISFSEPYVPPGYITNGLVLNQSFAGNALDATANHNNGTLFGAPSYVAGQGNQATSAISFNGSTQYVNDGGAAATSSLNLDTNMTMSAWVKAASFPSTDGTQAFIIDKGWDGSTEAFFLRWANHSGVISLEAGTNNGTGPEQKVTDSVTHYATGQWYFITVAYTASTITLYVNGRLISIQGSNYGVVHNNGSPVTIGTFNSLGSPSQFFNGAISNVAIYNRTLLASEVQTNFLNTEYSLGVATPDLLYYKMLSSEVATGTQISLHDYSTMGGATGIGNSPGEPWQWDANLLNPSAWMLHFHGDINYVDTGTSTRFNFTSQPFSISFWIQPQTPNRTIATNGFSATSGWAITYDSSYFVHFRTETAGVDHDTLTSNSFLDNTALSMVTITSDGTNLIMYINGTPVGSVSNYTQPASSPLSLIFGTSQNKPVGAGSPWLDGDLWNVQIDSHMWTAADVANLYSNQKSGVNWP